MTKPTKHNERKKSRIKIYFNKLSDWRIWITKWNSRFFFLGFPQHITDFLRKQGRLGEGFTIHFLFISIAITTKFS
jgi:hypothetical protein